DNFYIVLEHIGEIRASMPRGYYQELPKLASGYLEGSPRVYEVAIDLIAHTEGHLEADNVAFFVREFQRASAMTMGELWAIPTMLRLGLVENIRRLAARVVYRLDETASADLWADRIQEASGSPQEMTAALAAFMEEHPRLTPTFVARFLQHIRGYQRDFKTLIWLEQWMTEEGPSPEDAVSTTNQAMALTQVMIANSITSLRMIARHDWTEFFEDQSRTEQILRRDPAGAYPEMTFQTRDSYRHVVEELARGSGRPETAIAEAALERAKAASADRTDEFWRSHVGYYLVDDGRAVIEAAVGFRATAGAAARRWVRRHAELVYFGGFAAATALLIIIAQLLMPDAPAGWRILAG
ncbi:MAG: cyclic beta 1-2 glucan synthetase, partial [Gemmatimonadales bacterium]